MHPENLRRRNFPSRTYDGDDGRRRVYQESNNFRDYPHSSDLASKDDQIYDQSYSRSDNDKQNYVR